MRSAPLRDKEIRFRLNADIRDRRRDPYTYDPYFPAGGVVRKVAIVDVDPGRVHEHFVAKLGSFETEYLPGGFQNWAQSTELDSYFHRLSQSS